MGVKNLSPKVIHQTSVSGVQGKALEAVNRHGSKTCKEQYTVFSIATCGNWATILNNSY